MEKRKLGKGDVHLSIIGFGGIVVMNESQADANRIVATAIDKGINYFDVAPSYGDAQARLGTALESHRSSIFLACKTLLRSKKEALAELQNSLTQLRTNYFDLYQFHAVNTMGEVNQILKPGGAMDAVLDARDKGWIRYIGFSSHSEESALLLMNSFDFNTILFPFNFACWYKNNFGQRVLKLAKGQNLGILALKTFALRKWKDDEPRKWNKCWYHPINSPENALMALRFTLSLPVTSAVCPGHEDLLWMACESAEHYKPLSSTEEEQLKKFSMDLDSIFP